MLSVRDLVRRRQECPVCPVAALSFTLGLTGLRLCWLPGVNCVLGAAALLLGITGLVMIARSRGTLAGVEEAISGVVLGAVVVGLSVFFISALVASWR
ncbi:MAG: hypothetical protein QN173_04270 [Armatimonadota bacterium]|nr:hypothetical protein [Armatimonadota bacterium]MDR7402234.1 hypothetical protein [Armatimonadota bacterium]MDR7403362.1 hypothetical protein [Armatimonadota bacterium]MDR7436990.1 hypothetical protein [Armatimonadota bacterium]MDR7472236.1 hypothetical protein [Armatimonadota bacterium]